MAAKRKEEKANKIGDV